MPEVLVPQRPLFVEKGGIWTLSFVSGVLLALCGLFYISRLACVVHRRGSPDSSKTLDVITHLLWAAMNAMRNLVLVMWCLSRPEQNPRLAGITLPLRSRRCNAVHHLGGGNHCSMGRQRKYYVRSFPDESTSNVG